MEKRARKRKIKWQMMSFVSIAAIVIVFLFLIVFQSMKQILVRQYSKSALQSVTAVAGNMDYILRNVENQTNSILLNREMLSFLKEGNKEEYCQQLTGYFVSGSYIEGIYVQSGGYYWHVGADIYGNVTQFRDTELENTTGEILWLPTSSLKKKSVM